jgi:hypothetical protein
MATLYLSVVDGESRGFLVSSQLSTTWETVIGSAAAAAFLSLTVSVTKGAGAILACFFVP